MDSENNNIMILMYMGSLITFYLNICNIIIVQMTVYDTKKRILILL